MRVGRNLPQPLIEGQVVQLGESRGPAIHLLGRDAFDAAFDFRPGVGIARIQTAPVLLQVVVAKKPGANLVGQLDDFDPVRRHVLRARVQPDAVAVLQRPGPATDMVGGVKNLEVEVAQEVGRGQAGDSSPQHRDVTPLQSPSSVCDLRSRETTSIQSQRAPVRYREPRLHQKPRGSTQPSDLSNQEVVLGMGVFLQYTVIGLTVGSFYALVALGYTIVYGIIRLINFAQGDLSMVGGLVAFVQGTTMGTAMRALAVDHDAARLMGIDVDAVIRIAFVLGAMLAAASGVMLGIYYVQIHFTMGFLLGLRAFTAAVLGGIGNIPGAMVGGLLIGLLEAYTTGYLSGTWEDVVVFGVLITVLIVKPTGLFGERVAERM